MKSNNTKKDLVQLFQDGAVILDVRSPGEFAEAHFPGSLNIPVQALEERLEELDSSRTYIVCCAAGGRSAMACAILKARGFQDLVDIGPWKNLE